ncbi:MAG TPA: ribonuclease HII [Myxococcales bacterium]|jgi:ribonuclease HII|nr:ribonuclease HII [Myxococcales bacterium]
MGKDAASLPLADLRKRYLDEGAALPSGLLESLQADPRRGAQDLAKRLATRQRENRAEGQRLRHLLEHERELWSTGYQAIAGVDEAGVAPLAGPVVAAACILPHDFRPRGIDDSKKLDAAQREALEKQIKEAAIAWSLGSAEPAEIDALNPYHASLLAMHRAVVGLSVKPDFLLVDARKVPEVDIPQRGIVHGDALSLTIAAASILAKTARDRKLTEFDSVYPGYGFAQHKGYPTAEHFEALERLGVCPIHRRSYAPVRAALGLLPIQAQLPFTGGKDGKARS